MFTKIAVQEQLKYSLLNSPKTKANAQIKVTG